MMTVRGTVAGMVEGAGHATGWSFYPVLILRIIPSLRTFTFGGEVPVQRSGSTHQCWSGTGALLGRSCGTFSKSSGSIRITCSGAGMSTSGAEHWTIPLARGVECTSDELIVDLSDGRRISVPLEWYPRLLEGKPSERSHWELIGEGDGIHWPDLDEDLSVEGLLAGRRSGESESSFTRWLARRREP